LSLRYALERERTNGVPNRTGRTQNSFMCDGVRASFEFREIELRWDLVNDLLQVNPIYNASPGRKAADIIAIVRTDAGNEGLLTYWPLIPS
jgi:hypothetical protein